MSQIKITDLPQADSLTGDELTIVVQAGVSKKASVDQVITYAESGAEQWAIVAENAANSASSQASAASVSAGQANGYAQAAATSKSGADSAAATATGAANTATNARDVALTQATTATNAANAASASESAAAGYASTAQIQAGQAESSASTAAAQAGVATAQAVIATTQAGIATTGGDTATTQAGIATTQAGIATTQANTAVAAANVAQSSQTVAVVKANEAAASAAAANTSAGNASGSAASALAIYGSATAQQAAVATAQAQASLAAGYAASASSVVQQDLSGVTAQALHRSPNAVTAMFLYDTSKDSDGGAWTEKCQHTSWYNEPLMGKWLGAWNTEANARSVNATLGAELISNGSFSNGTAGWTATNASIAAANGLLEVNVTTAWGYVRQPMAVVSGRTYKISGFLRAGTVTTARVQVATAGTLASTTSKTGEYFETTWVAPSNLFTIELETNGQVGTAYFDDISVREVTALNTASGDYFQLTTDGKFYRLWKNLLKYSADFDNAAWTKANATVTANVVVAPDGTLSADKLVENTAVGSHVTSVQVASLTGTYTASVYAKAGERSLFELGERASIGSRAIFNLSNGTVALQTLSPQATITPVGDGWYRCSITVSGLSAQAFAFRIQLNTAVTSDQSYTGDGTSGIYLWGAQLEYGSTATTYEAKTADGPFTEVFRGNKAKFPKLAGIVAEAGNVNIYDLTEPGRPMWMRFGSVSASTGYPVSSLYSLNGLIGFGLSGAINQNGLTVLQFPKDTVFHYGAAISTNSGYSKKQGVRGQGTLGDGVWDGTLPLIANYTVNAVAMTVLPDAPVDPVTGLAVPTIAVGTAGGISVIKHDGLVVNSGGTYGTGAVGSVSINQNVLVATRADNRTNYLAYKPGSLAAGFPINLSDLLYANSANVLTRAASKVVDNKATAYLSSSASPGLVSVVRTFPSIYTKSCEAAIMATHNTGYYAGGVKRIFASDSRVGAVSGQELSTNGSWASDVNGWTVETAGASATWANPGLTINCTGTNAYSVVYQPISGLTVGETYAITVTLSALSATYAGAILTSSNLGANTNTTGRIRWVVYATLPTMYIKLHAYGSSGQSATFTNLTLTVADISKDNASITSSKNGANVFGTLTKSQVATGTSLVAYSGFSASNYLREPSYSADLDFGTGEWSVGAWVNVPVTLPAQTVLGTEELSKGVSAPNPGVLGGGAVSKTGNIVTVTDTTGTGYGYCRLSASGNPGYLLRDIPAGKRIVVSFSMRGSSTACNVGLLGPTNKAPVNNVPVAQANTWQAVTLVGTSTGSTGDYITLGPSGLGNALDIDLSTLTVKEYEPYRIASREYSSGPSINLCLSLSGSLQAIVKDGTSLREVVTTAAYNTATWLKAEAIYKTDGSLAILVNGNEVAVTRGNPLLTLNNSNAVLTIGNSYALDAPFPGSIALLKLSATAPTYDQALWMYEQEKQLFRDGAQCVLPDSGSIVDLTYDDVTDKWVAVSATNESSWTGLVRTNVTAVPAGSNSRVVATSGVKLNARTTTSPGVDVTIPAYGLREELLKDGEDSGKLARIQVPLDYVGGFTATTVTGNTAITSVAGLSYPSQTTIIGARVSGTGIPANTTIVGVSGTTIYLSAAATASASAVQISFVDFVLPLGMEAKEVISAGAIKTEGATKDFTRLYDGFRETIRFGTAPAYNALVQIQAIRSQT